MNRDDLRTIGFVAFMKLYLLVFVGAASLLLANRPADWNRWDAPHYIDIARDGYVTRDVSTQHQRLWIVFYPLYPWTVRAVNFVVRNFVVSAHLVSLLAAMGAAMLFRRLVELDFDRAIARSAVVFLFIFPTAYFFHAGYTESLFMAVALASVYAARQRQWDVAAIWGALASLTRVNGLLLIPVLAVEAFIEYREERRFRRAWLWIPVAAAGFIIYLAVNKVVWNDAFYFQKVLKYSWRKELSPPWTGIAGAFERAMAGQHMRGTQELVFIALALICTVWCWRRLRPSYAVWMTLNLLLITSTATVVSTPRYVLTFFPMFILFALAASKSAGCDTALKVWSLTFLALFAAMFGAGMWTF